MSFENDLENFGMGVFENTPCCPSCSSTVQESIADEFSKLFQTRLGELWDEGVFWRLTSKFSSR
jgi:hypothetical protein